MDIHNALQGRDSNPVGLFQNEHRGIQNARRLAVQTGRYWNQRSLSETNYSSSEIKNGTRRKHAKEESARVRAALSSDARALGTILNESHASISDNIRASTTEIDKMVKEIQNTAGSIRR